MGTEVIVLDLNHRLSGFVRELSRLAWRRSPKHLARAGTYLTLDLGDITTRPSLVRPHRHDSLSIDTSLQERLPISSNLVDPQ